MRMACGMVAVGHLVWSLGGIASQIKKEGAMERLGDKAVVLASFLGMLSHLSSAMAVKIPSPAIAEAVLIVLEMAYTFQGASLAG